MAWIDYKKAYDMVPQNWIIHCPKIYKISNEIIKFINRSSLGWRVELAAGRKSLSEGRIQRGIFQGDAQSPLLFVVSMMSLNLILRKCVGGYKITKSQEKNQSPNIYRRYQTVCQKWKRIGNPHTGSENIQPGHRNGIWHRKCAMLMRSGKRFMTEGIEQSNQEKINTRRKRNV